MDGLGIQSETQSCSKKIVISMTEEEKELLFNLLETKTSSDALALEAKL